MKSIRETDGSIRASVGAVAAALTDAPSLDQLWIPGRERLGIEAHQRLAERFPDAEPEFSVEGEYRTRGGSTLLLQGRADLVESRLNQIVVIECKSVALPPGTRPELDYTVPERFRLQARLYAYMLSQREDASSQSVQARLAILNLTDGSVFTLEVDWSPREVEEWLEEYLDHLTHTAALQYAAAARRRALARQLEFPYPSYRPGQKEIAEQIAEVFARGGDLLWNAPPGFGKTAAVLFPALRQALSAGGQLFFATAKTGGREPARHFLECLIARHPDLRAMILPAMSDLCPSAVPLSCRDCILERLHPDTWDRVDLPTAANKPLLKTEDFRAIGANERICPVDLARLLVRRVDVVIGDYNFIFDPSVRAEPFRRFLPHQPPLNWFLLIDEAHNLLTRGREIHSVRLQLSDVHACRDRLTMEGWRFDSIPAYHDLCAAVERAAAAIESALALSGAQDVEFLEPDEGEWRDLTEEWERALGQFLLRGGERVEPELHVDLTSVFEHLQRLDRGLDRDSDAFPFYVDGAADAVGIECLDPAGELQLSRLPFQSAAAFSGTMAPLEFYRDALGFGGKPLLLLESDSCFAFDRFLVTLARGIDTRLRERAASARTIAETLRRFCLFRPGGYLAVFPSFEFLMLTLESLGGLSFPVLVQRPRMTGEELVKFKESFTAETGTRLAMIVAGGQFSEGLDYPGDLCVGVAVVGPCLPPPDPFRDALKRYWQRRGEDGARAAYIIPAMQRVAQAGGRAIRSETDRAVTLLMDDRFMERRFLELLPPDWRESLRRVGEDWTAAVEEFWREPV